MVPTCPTCSSPLDDAGACVTCAAAAEGLVRLARNAYDQIRELQVLLEGQGVGAEIERVPPGTPQERHHPTWNLYVPREQVEQARAFLDKDWAELLLDDAASAAAARGQQGIDFDQGGDVTCPACGHRFAATAAEADCPECGLSLGVGDAALSGER
jgi:hypothetical protein